MSDCDCMHHYKAVDGKCHNCWKVWGSYAAPCASSLLDAAKILLPEMEKRARELRKSRHHNALHDLHIMECAITTIEDIIILENDPHHRPEGDA